MKESHMSIDVFINTVIHNTMKYSGYESRVCHSGNHFLEKPVLSLFTLHVCVVHLCSASLRQDLLC